MRLFKEGLKQELKLLKQEVEQLPKEQRKNTWRMRKEQLDRDQHERVRAIINYYITNRFDSMKITCMSILDELGETVFGKVE